MRGAMILLSSWRAELFAIILSHVGRVLVVGYYDFFYVYNCSSYEPWDVNHSDNEMATTKFQQFLLAWQYDDTNCARGTDDGFLAGGMGAQVGIYGATEFLLALEKGLVYRPASHWIWADKDPEGCTLSIRAPDCYTLELSRCGIAMRSETAFQVNPYIVSLNATYIGSKIDSTIEYPFCTLARMMKKPSVWVFGQIVHYLLRPRPDVAQQMAIRQKKVFPDDFQTFGTISVHYRAGTPDNNRVVHPLHVYMHAVATKASEMAATGKPVKIVYLASQDNLHVFRSVEYLQEKFPAEYEYRISDYQIKDGSEEVETWLREGKDEGTEVSRMGLAIEFMTDVSLFVSADVFIGSLSSIYITSTSLRYALHPERPRNHSCYIGPLENNPKLICEGDVEAMRIWQYYHKHGGHTGGTSF